MLLEQTTQEGTEVFRLLESRLDAHIADAFKDQVAQAIEGGATHIALDLGDVDFIDSSGLGAIVSCVKRLGGKQVAVCGLKESTLSIFKMTRLDQVIPLFDTIEEALAAGAGQSPAAP